VKNRLRISAAGAVLLCFWAVGCRDEQAGPRPRGAQPQGAQQQAQQGQPQQQQPTGAPRFLDAQPQMNFKSGHTWAGGVVEYLGSMVVPMSPQPGQQVRVAHYFRANKQPPQGYRFFVHVIDGDSKQQVGNADHEVQGGAAPLEKWEVGKIVEDVHGFQWPDYQGKLQLAVGFWNEQGRLPVDPFEGALGDNRMAGPIIGGGGPQALPEYKITRVAKPPTIDGKLDDAAWSGAAQVELTTSFEGKPAQRKTRAKLVYDDANIYLAFDCDDPDVWGTMKNKDDSIYNEEVVEAFFDADGDGKTYNELEVSPHNVQFDAAFVARRSDLPAAMKWESGMQSAVQVRGTLDNDSDQDNGWSVEMRVPIASLMSVLHNPPQKGDVWRFNLYRLEHFTHGRQIEGQSFSPLFMGDFHHLPRFGRLIFE
jgi:hypothetical protein